jgi:hypothetical protein
MDVFQLRDQVIGDYDRYVRSFLRIADPGVKAYVEAEMAKGRLWPDPLVQLNRPTRRAARSTRSSGRGCCTRSADGSSGGACARTAMASR